MEGGQAGAAQEPDADARRVVRTLLVPANPPATVGALFDALGVTLGTAMVDENASGTVVVPRRSLAPTLGSVQRIHARYAFEPRSERPVGSLSALRERRLVEFAVVCTARDAIVEALRARSGPPIDVIGAGGDDYRIHGRWVYTQRSCVLAWFEQLPSWLRTEIDAGTRRAALRALVEGVRGAADVAGLLAVASRLPPGCGLVHRREGDTHDAIELAFAPPIPAVELVDALVASSCVAQRSPQGWEICRLTGGGEPGPTTPLTMGSWVAAPRLENEPRGGSSIDPALHQCDALDVVVAMRIGRAPAPAPSRGATVAAALLDPAPPKTVGELCAALGVTLPAADVVEMSLGQIGVPDLSARYVIDLHHERPPQTIDELKVRVLLGWTATLRGGLFEVETALAARFGAPREAQGARVYDTWIVRPGDSPGAGALSHHARLPDWALPQPDAGARARALVGLASAAAAAVHPDALRQIAASVAAEHGIVDRSRPSSPSASLELVPAIAAAELARLFGWHDAVGVTRSVHQDSWTIALVTGQHEWGLTVAAPTLGRWQVAAYLDARPTGQIVGRLGPSNALAFAPTDVVRWITIGG